MTTTSLTPRLVGQGDVLLRASSTAADDVLFDTAVSPEISRYNWFELFSTAGVMDVAVSYDGTNFSTRGVTLVDRASVAPATQVIETAANKAYVLTGRFMAIRVYQKGATAVVGGCLMATQIGRS